MVAVKFLEWRLRWLLACTSLICVLTSCLCEKITKKVLITADDEKLRDPEGYEAIAQLHHQMDDDQSGSIDRFESTDFLKEDMQLGGSDRVQRERAFHHNNDELITVDDLWEAWFASEERSWTTADLVYWLENTVRLPQYAAIFIGLEIDGRALPRMAIANSTYLSSDLGIKNPVHKQKLRLKALDVVLFGFSVVLFVAQRQRTRSRIQMEQLASKLSQLKSMESHLEDVQQKFDEEKKKRQTGRDVPESEQVETLRSQLLEAERLLENSISAPLALQPLLRRTCELEMSYVSQQRMECIAEMREAIEHIDRLRKKQTSIVSSIKLATGASSGTDHIDSRIFSLKARMEKISLAMSECHQRWNEIESLCGFPLINSSTNTEPVFSSQITGAVLPKNASSCSFYRNPDIVGAPPTTSIISSSTSGNSQIVAHVDAASSSVGCLCTHEGFASGRHINATHLQKRLHESINKSPKPVRFTIANDEQLLARSVSAGSLNKVHHPRIQDISSHKNVIDPDVTSVASSVDSNLISPPSTMASSSSPPPPAAPVNNISSRKYDLKLIKRSFSNALFGSSNIKENGLDENRRQKSTEALISNVNKKSKVSNLFRKIKNH